MDTQTSSGLTAGQAYKIAEYAARNEYYSLGFDWLKTTEVLMKEQNDTSVSTFSLANTYKRLIEKVSLEIADEFYMYVRMKSV